jgi:serine/threonine protein kinase
MTAETPMDSAGKYVFIKELGRGAFGAVVLARNTKTNEQVAIKKMERAHLQVRGPMGVCGGEGQQVSGTSFCC